MYIKHFLNDISFSGCSVFVSTIFSYIKTLAKHITNYIQITVVNEKSMHMENKAAILKTVVVTILAYCKKSYFGYNL